MKNHARIKGVTEDCHRWFAGAIDQERIRPVDQALAGMLAENSGLPEVENSVFAIAVAVLSASTRDGHTLLDLGPSVSSPFLEDLPETLPHPVSWSSILSKVAGSEKWPAPVILDRDGLYLYRYYQAEVRVASELGRRLVSDRTAGAASQSLSNLQDARAALDRLFPLIGSPNDPVNAGRAAAEASLRRSLLVITGGPGTGKTWTAARILALHRALFPDARIVAAAPTGKAAARMGEALSGISDFGTPVQAMTLHRLLEAGSRGFSRGRENPLDWEFVLMDELSMIDLPLMDRLLGALSDSARLVLTGDRDQLSSVGAGSVMSDLCSTLSDRTPENPDKGALTLLTHNFRQLEFPALQEFSRAVAKGEEDLAITLLQERSGGLSLVSPVPGESAPFSLMREWWDDLSGQASPEEGLSRLDRFMTLTPLKEGPAGSSPINRFFHSQMRRHWQGKPPVSPVLILENSYESGLMNGDLGVLFRSALHLRKEGRTITLPERLAPEWGFAYAMTIHKSQGSEFDHVLLLLGATDHPLLTRSLLYTGATRARKRLTIWASPEILKRMIRRPIERASALDVRLWDYLSQF